MSSNESQTSSERSEEIKRSFNWNIDRMQLLGKLLNVLSGVLQQWNAFVSPNGGDIEYLSDLQGTLSSKSSEFRDNNGHAGRSIRAIQKTFRSLEHHRQKLEFLKDDLSTDYKTVSVNFSWAAPVSLRKISRSLYNSLHCSFPWKATMQANMPH